MQIELQVIVNITLLFARLAPSEAIMFCKTKEQQCFLFYCGTKVQHSFAMPFENEQNE
jgi:hypothetical protein